MILKNLAQASLLTAASLIAFWFACAGVARAGSPRHLRSARVNSAAIMPPDLLDWVACLPPVFEDPLATDL